MGPPPKSDLQKTKPDEGEKPVVDLGGGNFAQIETGEEKSDSEDEEVDLTPCAGLRKELMICLMNSDCVQKEGKEPRDCVQVFECPSECFNVRNQFFQCKRSILDARQRFRGRKGY